jgi:tetratricopeptide (TPR) repeat protein
VTRNIVFVGNCQLGMLADVYRRLVAVETDDTVDYVPAYENAGAEQRQLIADAEEVVVQVLDFAPRIGKLDTGGKVHLVPSVRGTFLWPHTGQPHPRNAPAPLLDRSGPYPLEIGDAFLNRMIARNIAAAEAVAIYMATDIAQERDVDRRYAIMLEQQRKRDRACGYEFADFIEQNFRKQKLFRTPNHPESGLSMMLAAEVFDRIGVDTRIIDAMRAKPPTELLPVTETPLHPSIIAHFGLGYASQETRYRYFNEGGFTFAEYAFRYMTFTWNPALAEALHLYRINRPDEAVSGLERALKLSPRSALGHYVLAELMARNGRLREAIELAFKAVLLEPSNVHFQARLDHLLETN